MSDAPLAGWTPPPPPPPDLVLEGAFVRLEPFRAADHAAPVHARARGHEPLFDYLLSGPFGSAEAYAEWIETVGAAGDPLFFALVPRDLGEAAGHASYLRIAPQHGSIELGHILLTPALQRSRAATEAWALMMGWAFDAGYRRFEWKCNAENRASMRAAERLGFTYEGTHRQAMVARGRNRDTAWFSVIDSEWPERRGALEAWLAPGNFDSDGCQIRPLAAFGDRAKRASVFASNAP